MSTSTQAWSLAGRGTLPDGQTYIADGTMFLPDKKEISAVYFLDNVQSDAVAQAMGLWDDVSGFTPVQWADDSNRARDAKTLFVDKSLFGSSDPHWGGSLSIDWSRIALADFTDPAEMGVNIEALGPAGVPASHYHEIYIGTQVEGVDTMRPGTTAFSVLVHEIGHSVLGSPLDPKIVPVTKDLKHIDVAGNQTIMDVSEPNDASIWHPSTPMPLDIDYTTTIYGPATTTRTGDDTYGFNAHFSDGHYRSALDFNVNTRPLITIFDNGGNDTLDASGFRDASGAPRPVHVDLNPGNSSWMLDGSKEVFAVIYQGVGPTTWIENAVGGGGDDELFGNEENNRLEGGAGQDTLNGSGGADTMLGGEGDDTYYVDNVGDVVDDTIFTPPTRLGELKIAGGYRDAGSSHDEIITSLSHYDLSNVGSNSLFLRPYDQHHLFGVIENLTFNGTGSFTGIGNDADNVITGGTGNDHLEGGGGADTLIGFTGADTLIGGTGDDTYYVDNANDVVDETIFAAPRKFGDLKIAGGYHDAGSAHDTVITSLSSYDLSNVGTNSALLRPLDQHHLFGVIEDLKFAGTGSFAGIGNDADNVIYGGDAGDLLSGGRGNDTIYGLGGSDGIDLGEGDDKAYIDNGTADGGDVVVGGGGFDSVFADGDAIKDGLHLNVFRTGTAFTPYVNRVAFTSAAIDVDYVEGAAGNDVINASALDQHIEIHGKGGNDTITGGAGDDWLFSESTLNDEATIIGGAGADGMIGGLGSDKFVMDNGTELGGDVAIGGDGFDTVIADASVAATGLSLVLFAADTPITADVNGLSFTSAAMGVEAVIGGTGNDLVDAHRLGDNEHIGFQGNEGNDKLILGHTNHNMFDGGGDTDTVVYSGTASNYEFRHALASDGFLSPDAIVVEDKTTGVIDAVRSVETVQFDDGTFSMDDLLTGTVTGAGHTRMGLVGETDPIPGQTLIGTPDSDTLTGGPGNDRIEGGDGNDFLIGGPGADQLLGGNGTDFLYVDAEDTLIDGGDGFDYVYLDSSKSYGETFKVAGTNVECVSGTLASDTIDATGVTYGVIMNGNYGNDVLIGGAGSDSIDGSADNDTLTGGGGNDIFRFGSHWGNDTITDFTHGQDVLDMTGVAGLTSMSQLTITNTAQGASITFGADSILLQGITAGNLTASDFHFLV
jgi:Ca2+-binding RTX toxin-like protein